MTQLTYTGTAGADLLDASGLAAGNTAVLRGQGGSDTLVGSSGNDRFDGGVGGDVMLGGAGDDMFFVNIDGLTGGPRDTIFGGEGNDRLVLTASSTQFSTAVLDEMARFDQYLSTIVPADPTAHFISDILHVDFAEGDAGFVRVDGVVSTVQQVVNGPTAAADTYATEEDTPLVVDAAHGLLANDSLGAGALTAVAGTYATALGGSVTIAADGSFTYAPAANANGADSFSYGARDALGRVSTATASIAVAAVNDAPVVTSAATASFAENGNGTAYAATATDVDAGTTLTWSLAGTDAALFTIDASTGAVRFKAAPDYEAPADAGQDNVYDIDVVASDGVLSTSKAVAIGVTDVTEAHAIAPVSLNEAVAGTGGFMIIGENAMDRAGWTVSAVGDVNGDGLADLLVGATGNTAGGYYAGAAYVVFGKADATAVDLDAVALGTGGFKIIGETAYDEAGYALAAAGDINHDGLADILVSAIGNRAGGNLAGATYVVYGKADGTAIDLDTVAAGTGGFKIIGETAGGLAGSSVSAIGDINHDGIPDFLIGAPGYDGDGEDYGAAYLVFGKTGGTAIDLDTVAAGSGGFRIVGETDGDNAGWSVAAVGDVNHDGITDLLIGARGEDAGGSDAGAAYLVFGKLDGTVVSLSDVAAGTGGFKIIGENHDDEAGGSVSAAGDVNGDGIPDLLIGATGNDAGGNASSRSNEGAAYVVFGKADGTAVNLDAVALGTGGFKIIGQEEGDAAGYAVSAAGDINGDGFADLLVSAPKNDTGARSGGAVYVVFGKADTAAVDLDAVALGTGGFMIFNETAYDQAGRPVMAVGDVNGDGYADLLLGALGNSAAGDSAGAAYVIYGRADWAL